MPSLVRFLVRFYCAFLILGGMAWAVDLPFRLGFAFTEAEWLAFYISIGTAAVFLKHPYGKDAGIGEVLLGLAAIAAWTYGALHLEAWVYDFSGNTPQKYVPALIALLLVMEALRKACGLSITLLVWTLIAYGLFGHYLPGPIQAAQTDPRSLAMYLFTDTGAILGLVMSIVATLVLAFVIFGRMMEVSGATNFFTDIALAAMGHKRGGPAKVAIVASALFGSVSSSPVGNIVSTGVMTIPLMKRSGFKPSEAAAIEAVASTGGQIAPPVMGATAFLMAEFLQISYFDVVIAALLPAFFYYACLFMQVDAEARNRGLVGMARDQLPSAMAALRTGWIFVFPLGVLIYLLFFTGSQPAFAALGSALVLLALSMAKKRFLNRADWANFLFDGGEGMLPLIMIGAGAGIVIGIMNLSGLGESLSFLLVEAARNWGSFVMLVLTAILSIILGMGMPSTAIYIVLATVIAPALNQMGIPVLASHMFIFYFGVMSFLTPPVAVSSYVAAGLAKAPLWETGWTGMRYSAIAFVVPFLWCYEPALLLDDSVLAISTVTAITLGALMIYAKAQTGILFRLLPTSPALGPVPALIALALVVAPIVFGPTSPISMALALVSLLAGFWPAASPRSVQAAGA